MLTITAVSTGAVEYLLRGSGCAEHEHAERAGQKRGLDGAGYMLAGAEKEPAGVWFGTGLEDMLGIEVGTTATEEQVRAVLGRLEHPTQVDKDGDPVSLGSRPRRFKSREDRVKAALVAEPDATEERQEQIRNQVRADTRKAVAYYDLTFSPVKSVSVYWATLVAAGRMAEAANVVEAHRVAVAEAMAYVEREAGFVRSGFHGKTASGRSVGVYEQAKGLSWIRWDHSTNRDQQPQLHSHVTLVNRAETSSDGEIRALDGKGFRPIKQGADAIYRQAYERVLTEANRVVFVTRADGKAREIMGYDQRLLGKASSRRRDIAQAVGVAAREFAERYGRAPSPVERKSMDRVAWRETRAPKNHLVAPGQQLRNWVSGLRGELERAL
ncbi:MAG: relaxase domain-containing protein, partial [Pseudonocardia sp.]|nr:relaxase domain-containing protein [Pseudonocardia sp.]